MQSKIEVEGNDVETQKKVLELLATRLKLEDVENLVEMVEGYSAMKAEEEAEEEKKESLKSALEILYKEKYINKSIIDIVQEAVYKGAHVIKLPFMSSNEYTYDKIAEIEGIEVSVEHILFIDHLVIRW